MIQWIEAGQIKTWVHDGAEIAVLVLGWVAVWALLSRFHPLQQFWHDVWAGTRLVHFEHPRT